MKKSTVLRLSFVLFAAAAARGQVFNLHETGQQGFPFYNGYNVLAFGQGAAHDPGNNVWNGFGNGTPGTGWCFGSPHTDDGLLPGNPGNPYAWSHSTPSFANGTALFSPSVAAGGGWNHSWGNATSAGAHSPVTVPVMTYGSDSGTAFQPTNNLARTNVAPFILSGAATVNATHPGIGAADNPLGLITLSNVPPGNYDLYLYGANFDGTRGAAFFSSSGTPSNGVSVAINPYAAPGSGPLTNFVFGTNFVVFNNVSALPDSTIHVTWGAVNNPISGLSGEGDFNGLQLVPAPGVAAAPFLNQEPANATFSQGTTASLTAQISGYPAIAYQWYEGAPPGTLVSGQTSNTLTFPNSLASQTGSYFVIGSNAHGSVTSSVVNLTIFAAPDIAAESSTNDLMLFRGDNHFGMSLTTFGQAPLVYYWRANGAAVAITTNVPSVAFTNITASAVYDCVVSNSFGRATNDPTSVTVVTAPNNPYTTALLGLKPYAYWPLTEPNGGFVAFDYLGGNNGAINGATTPGSPGPGNGFGNSSSSYLFDGISGYVDIPGAPVNFTGPLTLVAWTLSAGGSSFQTTVGKGDTSYRFDQDGGGIAHFANGSGPDAVGGPNLKFGNIWHQIVGVYDAASTNIYLYVDGAQVATQKAGSTPGSSLDLWIGCAPDYGPNAGSHRFFDGSIAQVALFNYALSASQVQGLYNAGEAPPFIVTDVIGTNGYVGGTVSFKVVASGASPLAYQWTGPGGAIPGATNATLVVTNLNGTGSPANSGPGNYSCTITNLYGSTNSAVALLSVGSSSPFFLQDLPATSYAIVGSPAVVSVQVAGNAPFTNQWYSGSLPPLTPLHDGDRNGRVSGSTNQTLIIANAQTSDAGSYQIAVTNGIAPYYAVSAVGQLVVQNEPAFNGTGAGWTANGGASFNTDVLTLTDGAGGEARSAWFNVPMSILSFRAGFTYQSAQGSSGTSLADGVTFCIQNASAGPAALGGGGGQLGYFGIPNSAALCVDLYNARGYQWITGGADPSASGNYVVTAPTVDTGSGHPIRVTIVYNGNNFDLTMQDTTTLGTYRTNFVVGSIASLVGTNTAFVGFTGATGGSSSIQTISSFSFIPTPVASAKRNGSTVTLSWPTGVGGYVLQKNSSVSNAAGWTTIAGPYPIVGPNYQVTVTPTPATGVQFYRLMITLP